MLSKPCAHHHKPSACWSGPQRHPQSCSTRIRWLGLPIELLLFCVFSTVEVLTFSMHCLTRNQVIPRIVSQIGRYSGDGFSTKEWKLHLMSEIATLQMVSRRTILQFGFPSSNRVYLLSQTSSLNLIASFPTKSRTLAAAAFLTSLFISCFEMFDLVRW